MTDEIEAAFAWTEWDFVANHRGGRMVQDAGYDSFVMRAGFLLVTHVFLVAGVLVVGLALFGKKGSGDPIPPLAVAFNVAVALACGYVLYTRWYARDKFLREAFLESQTEGLKASYRFAPLWVDYSSNLAQSRRDWQLIDRVVEFRDGFMLVSGAGAEWIPRHAFAKDVDAARFTEFVRDELGKHQRIDRAAGLAPAPGFGKGLGAAEEF